VISNFFVVISIEKSKHIARVKLTDKKRPTDIKQKNRERGLHFFPCFEIKDY
jgi:hypothetical protein